MDGMEEKSSDSSENEGKSSNFEASDTSGKKSSRRHTQNFEENKDNQSQLSNPYLLENPY